MTTEPPKIRFNQARRGDYLVALDFSHAFEVVRSGDVMRTGYGGTMSPDSLMLRCYKVDPGGCNRQFNPGDLTQDYFNQEFYSAPKPFIDSFYAGLERKLQEEKC